MRRYPNPINPNQKTPFKMHPGMPTVVPHQQQPINKGTSTGGCGCGKTYKMLPKR